MRPPWRRSTASTGVTVREADLEGAPWPFAGTTFDAIVVANYLHRPLFAPLLDALAADGVLLYETFALGNEAFGRPSNPDFLLAPHELLEVARGRSQVVAFEQGRVDDGGRTAVVQRIAAVGHAQRLAAGPRVRQRNDAASGRRPASAERIRSRIAHLTSPFPC